MNELRMQLQTAYAEFQQAEQNFNYAEPGFIDTAIYNLKASEEKIKAIKTKEERRSEKQVSNYQINNSLSVN